MKKLPAFAGCAVVLIGMLSGCARPQASTTAPAAPVEARAENARTVSLTGTVAGGSGSVTGTFSIGTLRNEAGTLVAVGSFTGKVRDGGRETSGTSAVAIPVLPGTLEAPGGAAGSCGGLRLRLLPSQVSLLGVSVRFDPALIDIVSAPANLLGNLACQATGLLRGALAGTTQLVGGAANQLVGILNQILSLLVAVV
jgi:hypothetical protein